MIVLRAFNDNGDKFDLDLFEEDNLKLDISAIESGDIGVSFGVSSQQYSLPSTKINDEYFGRLWNLGSTPSTSFIKTFACQVLYFGNAAFKGRIYLDNVVTDKQGDTIYNVVLINETLDFKYQVQDLTFGDLDWSELDHELNITNITSSWDKNLFDGDVVYPLAEYGSQEGQLVGISELRGGGALGTFTNENTPLRLNQFKPAIRIRKILDKIFETTNYEYTSSFFEDERSDDIYMLSTRDENTGTNFLPKTIQNGRFTNNQVQTITPLRSNTAPFQIIPGTDRTQLLTPTEIFRNTGTNFNTTTSIFTADVQGDYEFGISLDFEVKGITNQFRNNNRTVLVRLLKNGVRIPGVSSGATNLRGVAVGTTRRTFITNFANIPLDPGDEISIEVIFNAGAVDPASPPQFQESIDILNTQDTFFEIKDGPGTAAEATVSIKNIFDPNIPILDFLNGLIQKFNLVIEPSREDNNIILVETFNDWVDQGQLVNWTNIVDRDIKWEIKHPMVEHEKEVLFSDEEDDDALNKYTKDTFNKIYGERLYKADSDLSDGRRQIGTFFAPTPMKYIPGTNNFIVPQLNASNNGKKESIAFKPRLLYFSGKKSAFPLIGRRKTGVIRISFGVYFFADGDGNITELTEYPVFHHLQQIPADGTTKDLHFHNLKHYSYHQSYVDARTHRDAFFEYWSFYINELYDVESRKLTCNVIFNPNEIFQVKLNDRIFIDGHYYRINKIKGANLTEKDSVEVELIKTLPRKLRFPRRRRQLPGGGIGEPPPVDIVLDIQDGDVQSGIARYVDYNTGNEVIPTGSGETLIRSAAELDGVTFKGEFVEIFPQRVSSPNNNLSLGVNFIDDKTDNSIVIGSHNLLEGNVKDSLVIGSSNNLGPVIDSSLILGSNIDVTGSIENSLIISTDNDQPISVTDAEGIIALNPIKPIDSGSTGIVLGNVDIQGSVQESVIRIEASDANTYFLTGSNIQNHLHYLSWDGVDGQFTIQLPLAEENQGISFKFSTDETFNSDREVQLLAETGETIRGDQGFVFSDAYNTATIYAVDNEWVVFT